MHMAKICRLAGYETILYGSANDEGGFDEVVEIITDEDRKEWFGNINWDVEVFGGFDANEPWWVASNERSVKAIQERIEPGDMIGIIAGRCQQPIVDSFPNNITFEWSVGYEGIISQLHHCFESEAWRHHLYGKYGINDGRFFDTVIPNSFESKDFMVKADKEDYILFISRQIPRKGTAIVEEIAKHHKVLVAGQGEARIPGTEYIGVIRRKEKMEYLANAKALIQPTLYIGPFEGTAVEAQLSGTPVITTDFGAFCVPLDTEILTRRGWLHYNEIQDGDETLGYDHELKINRWTKITQVNVFNNQQTKCYRNRNWRIRTTEGHRWVGVNKNKTVLAPFENLMGRDDKVILSAIACDGDLDIAPNEAGLIAWILCDGSMETRMHGLKRERFNCEVHDSDDIGNVRIWQSKPEGIEALKLALTDFQHTLLPRKGSGNPKHLERYVARMHPDIMRKIFYKAEVRDRGLIGFILGLTQEARKAFLQACIDAEGWQVKGRQGTKNSTLCIAQNEGSLCDAMVLCAYLCGYRPTISSRGTYKTKEHFVISLCNPIIVPARLHQDQGFIEDVWCPSTELGTWTMRSNGHIVLTGNTETVEHGVTGYRCRTLKEFLNAANNVGELNPWYIKARAERLYTLEAVAPAWKRWFDQLTTLYAGGWYEGAI